MQTGRTSRRSLINTDLANQVVHCILLINNKSTSTGLYMVPDNLIPRYVLDASDVVTLEKDGWLYAQLDEPVVDIQLGIWTPAVYKLLLCCIIEPISRDNVEMINIIGKQFGLYLNPLTMRAGRIDERKRRLGA